MKSFSGFKVNGFFRHHIQGIAIDKNREYMYLSFTTCLVKTDLTGNIIGSVNGLVGHLGCLAYNYDDGRVYASLEYKNDSVGRGIQKSAEEKVDIKDSFYIAIFDVEKITRQNLDAEKDGIMKTVYIKDVVDDYSYLGHRYGCSGIDGVTFAPAPGEKTGNSLFVAYGIYRDNKRKDNDHQIILRYDMGEFNNFEAAINQEGLHKIGPEKADDKHFIYTGNTTYGIQNLEYDKDNNCLFAAVYKGRKFRFPNYLMFSIDIENSAVNKKLKGLNEQGSVLPLKKLPFFKKRGKISGCNFPYGSTGMISLGSGQFIFSEDFKDENGYGTNICAYKLDVNKGFNKKEIFL